LSNGRQHDGYLVHVYGPRLGALSVLSVLTSDDAQIGLVYLLGASAGAALAYDAERAGAPASESQPARAAIVGERLSPRQRAVWSGFGSFRTRL